MNSKYSTITKKYEEKYGKAFCVHLEVETAYTDEIEMECNIDYDTFIQECKIEDAKAGVTEKEEYATGLYKEMLDEFEVPYEDVFYALYCERCFIKGKQWSDPEGYADRYLLDTALVLDMEHPYLHCSGGYKFFSVADVI